MPDKMLHTCTQDPMRWLNISVSVDIVMEWVRAHEDEFDLGLLKRSLRLPLRRPPESLLSLASRMLEVEESLPHRLHTPIAECSARTEILETIFRTLPPMTPAAHARRFNARRMRILDRVLELLRAVDYATLQTKDLYEAAGVSERTLRDIFNEYLGMSPHRYVMLRRLYEIRSAIHSAAPEDTITTICARFGVWDFGRLAKLYKSYFGLLPSQSLHKRGAGSSETRTVCATAA